MPGWMSVLHGKSKVGT